jgi:hypothetical protein
MKLIVTHLLWKWERIETLTEGLNDFASKRKLGPEDIAQMKRWTKELYQLLKEFDNA